jgi:uncharacterized Zn finger protein (UPF0148 family)
VPQEAQEDPNMTTRAERAAQELARRGWEMCDELKKNCPTCGTTSLYHGARFCPQCGAKVPAIFDSSVMDDLEAALVAALDV